MKAAMVTLVLMASGFLISWSHRSLREWHLSESLPWSTERSPAAGAIFEVGILFILLFFAYLLFQLPRWRQQTYKPAPPAPPRDRVKAGAAKLAGLLATVLVAVWMGDHIDTGLEFHALASRVFGLRTSEIRNAAAMFTLIVVLGAVTLCAFILFGSQRAVASPPAPLPSQRPVPPPPARRPFP